MSPRTIRLADGVVSRRSAQARRRHRTGPLARREAALARTLLAPTFLIVFAIVLFPLLANFWISAKPVKLGDLRAPSPIARERVSGEVTAPGDSLTVAYRLRNSSTRRPIAAVTLEDRLPLGLEAHQIDPRCTVGGNRLRCGLGDWSPGYRDELRLIFTVTQDYLDAGEGPRDSAPVLAGDADNVLTSLEFTLANFRKVFNARQFWSVLKVSLLYTVFGTLGSLVLGLFAAQLLNTTFRGRTILRGLFLFPYVSPVIAVAFTWVFLLDPFSGTLNALLQRAGVIDAPINFLGQRTAEATLFGLSFDIPVALVTVIAFEAWRYFPLAFLFILARLQALPTDLYEAAEVDGATPLQKFRFITLPQLAGILSVLFMLRFIWTFNKFDDIFLLTGGAAGTRTLTVEVYEQAFGQANLGAGAAVAVVIFLVLALYMVAHFAFAAREEGL